MKTIYIACMLGLAVPPLLGASACTTTRMAGEQLDDVRISGRVQRRMTVDPEVDRFDIDVDTLDGVVTLRGEVESETMKTSAERIARDTPGVKQVKNKLTVESEKHSGSKDLGIRARVGTRLSLASDVDRMSIDVDVEHGVVTLSGVVHDEKAKTQAEKIARETKGVKDVKNELTVNPDDQLFRRDTQDEPEGGTPAAESQPETPPESTTPP